MRPRTAVLASLPALLVLACFAGCGDQGAQGSTASSSSSSASSSSGTGGAGGDPESLYYPPPLSCAYECATLDTCVEQTKPYACPTVAPWSTLPHESACPAWDGTYPKPVAGKCAASAPSGEAVKRAGVDPADPAAFILPDGRRLHPAGHEWILTDVSGGLTSQVVDVPGTPFALTVETGFGNHAVRAVDVTKLAAGVDPVVSKVIFVAPETLNAGLALAGKRAFVASHDGAVHAIDLDPATGALTRNDGASVMLPQGPKGNLYASGVAVSPDGTKLVVSTVDTASLYVFSIAGDATYGAQLGSVGLSGYETFGVYFDPHDPTGATVYVSLWADKKVQAIDLSIPAAPVVKATYATDKNPQGIAFLDARYLVVADANGDSVSIVDRVTSTVTSVPIEAGASPLHGAEPSMPAVDPATGRLYVALGGDNAVAAFDVDTSKSPPVVTRAGLLGTGWWPSGVIVRADGALVVTSLRGHGGGPIPQPFPFGDNDIGDRMKGSVQWIAAPSTPELVAGAKVVSDDDDPGKAPGAPAVNCPMGASDFPLPAANQGGSPVIDHVFFILRENKNFDAIFGDLAGADGAPTYTLKSSSKDMDAIWHAGRCPAGPAA